MYNIKVMIEVYNRILDELKRGIEEDIRKRTYKSEQPLLLEELGNIASFECLNDFIDHKINENISPRHDYEERFDFNSCLVTRLLLTLQALYDRETGDNKIKLLDDLKYKEKNLKYTVYEMDEAVKGVEFIDASDKEKDLMDDQLKTLKRYQYILLKRIELLERDIENEKNNN